MYGSLRSPIANNTAIGYRSGYAITTGSDNFFAGYQAGDAITTADYCILIGSGVDGADATTDYQLNIGNCITGTCGTSAIGVDANTTAAETRLLVWDVNAGALVRVSVGAADSGGGGYKLLRVPN